MQPDDEDKAFWFDAVCNINHEPQTGKYFFLSPVSTKFIIPREHQYFATIQDFSTYSKALEDDAFGGIDKNTLHKFKREEFAIEATLDLHGKTENSAYEAVADFIPRCYASAKRCICIITGKGMNVHADNDIFPQKGVLKQLVPQWLNAPHLRGMILIYKHPSARLGGDGALYILLRRQPRK